MFTGIIEHLAEVIGLEKDGTNLHLTFSCPIAHELKIDQSVSHNGVCLTVTEISVEDSTYAATAIEETLSLTNLGELVIGDIVNIERAMVSGARLDGHIVQGHVDGTGECIDIRDVDGSRYFTFSYQPDEDHFLVNKGSICINGVSLTVVKPINNEFSVAIIPYTYENTSFRQLKSGDKVNLEFDVLGKYVAKYMQLYLPK